VIQLGTLWFLVPFESFSPILDFEMELVDTVQGGWEIQDFWKVAGGQAEYQGLVPLALKIHVKATESSPESLILGNFFAFNMLQSKKMTGFCWLLPAFRCKI